ncbi:MAG: response regulator transcription factor [Raoultibacter sp.]
MREPQKEILIGGPEFYGKDSREVRQHLRGQGFDRVRIPDAVVVDRPMLRVVIVDDQDLVRNGFRLILSSFANITVVGEAGNGTAAVACALETRPDVVLMDIRMPIENGIDATREIATDPRLKETRVLILTTFDIDEYVYDALSAGASGFMLKDAEPDEIAHAIEVVASGDALIQPSITRRLVETFVHSRPSRCLPIVKLDALTDREREVLVMVAHGLTNDQIAHDLVISPATVKTHAARIMSKLDAHDRAQLVVLAYENGLVVPGV